MDILDTSRSDHLLGLLNGPGDVFRGFDFIDLDVDHSEADSDFPVEILDGLKVVLGKLQLNIAIQKMLLNTMYLK